MASELVPEAFSVPDPLSRAPQGVLVSAIEELVVGRLKDFLELCDESLPWIKSDLEFSGESPEVLQWDLVTPEVPP